MNANTYLKQKKERPEEGAASFEGLGPRRKPKLGFSALCSPRQMRFSAPRSAKRCAHGCGVGGV